MCKCHRGMAQGHPVRFASSGLRLLGQPLVSIFDAFISITMLRIMIDPGHPSDSNSVGITLPVQTQTILDKAGS